MEHLCCLLSKYGLGGGMILEILKETVSMGGSSHMGQVLGHFMGSAGGFAQSSGFVSRSWWADWEHLWEFVDFLAEGSWVQAG